jgi:YVTN family beta-propeller protein
MRSCVLFCLGAPVAVALLAGCGTVAKPDPEEVPVLRRASKSGTIAITGDDRLVLMVNPEADSLAVFDATTGRRTALVPVGDEPSAVVIHPDDDTAYVALRGSAAVVEVTGLAEATPRVGAPVAVGSEPTGLALSPTGRRLYVAEWAEGRIAVLDTTTMTEIGAIDAPKHPRGLAVTNNGDQDDDDELVIVPEFFGEPIGVEGSDTSRQGRVRIYGAGDLAPQSPIVLAPIDSGFTPDGADDPATVMTSPNQLWTALVVADRIYVPSISASPAPPVSFSANVHPVLYVGDLERRAEERGPTGTVNLARLVRDQIPDEPRLFLADLVDVGAVGDDVLYVLSRGADALQRLVIAPGGPILGAPQRLQIDLNVVPAGSTQPCQGPTGVVIGHETNRAFVNCWASRQLGIVDFSTQALSATVEAAPISIAEADAQGGLRFFFTGRGRWSKDGWSSCGSCHPDGLTDNITWIFPAGPRQTTSMDGSFSHGPGPQRQRVFNWTGIFDEIHDFERNTRDVSGGFGAVTTAPEGGCGDLTQETPVALAGGLGRPVRDDQLCNDDWDQIEAYARTIRPPLALRRLDAEAVARGRRLFGEDGGNGAGCVRCHGGPGWTASRLHFVPRAETNAALQTAAFAAPAAWPSAGALAWTFHSVQIANQPTTTAFGAGVPEAEAALGPPQVACVLRNVGTFGDDALEVRNFAVNGTPGARAQGLLGYNVPSLYGLAVGAPYLHHGQAADLPALFDEPAWRQHATAGNPNWLTGDAATVAQRKADLIAFLLSIDAAEPEQAIPGPPTGPWDGCP